MKLTQALTLKAGMTLSIVGGGGKTSMMFALARELSDEGCRTLVTTTTAIRHPDYENRPYHGLILGPYPEVFPPHIKQREVIVAARYRSPNTEKLQGYAPETINAIHHSHRFDYILV